MCDGVGAVTAVASDGQAQSGVAGRGRAQNGGAEGEAGEEGWVAGCWARAAGTSPGAAPSVAASASRGSQGTRLPEAVGLPRPGREVIAGNRSNNSRASSGSVRFV